MKNKYLLTCESRNIKRVFASVYGAANTAFSLAVDHAYQTNNTADVDLSVEDIAANLRAGFLTHVGFGYVDGVEGLTKEEIVKIEVITGIEAEQLNIGSY